MRAERRAAARVARAVAALALAGPVVAFCAEPGPERERELEHLLIHDCGSCHGMRLTGGLGPALTADAMRGRSEAVLAQLIAGGVPGTPMPPWLGILDADEIHWMARRLRQGGSGG